MRWMNRSFAINEHEEMKDMSTPITIEGNVGHDLELKVSPSGTEWLEMRVAVAHRRKDDNGQWVDDESSWYSVKCFNSLASNVADSVRKGNRVVVVGKLRIREFTRDDGTNGKSADIIADDVGLSLRWAVGSVEKATSTPPTQTVPADATDF